MRQGKVVRPASAIRGGRQLLGACVLVGTGNRVGRLHARQTRAGGCDARHGRLIVPTGRRRCGGRRQAGPAAARRPRDLAGPDRPCRPGIPDPGRLARLRLVLFPAVAGTVLVVNVVLGVYKPFGRISRRPTNLTT